MSSIYVNKDLSLKKVRLSKKYHKFMRQMGMRDVYEVPIRKNGMTGSGMLGECHDNVCKLQAVYGGKVVNGFTIERGSHFETGEKVLIFRNHSVWQTPEGKLVDVTYNLLKAHQDTFWFSPIVSYDSSKTFVLCPVDFLLPKFYRKRGLFVESSMFNDGGVRKTRVIEYGKYLNHKTQVFSMNKPYFKVVDCEENPFSFSKPSSATGTSWLEIWTRFISDNDLSLVSKPENDPEEKARMLNQLEQPFSKVFPTLKRFSCPINADV